MVQVITWFSKQWLTRQHFLLSQVHRGIKGVVRDKLTKKGIADAIIKVEDHDHDIRSGQPVDFLSNEQGVKVKSVKLQPSNASLF